MHNVVCLIVAKSIYHLSGVFFPSEICWPINFLVDLSWILSFLQAPLWLPRLIYCFIHLPLAERQLVYLHCYFHFMVVTLVFCFVSRISYKNNIQVFDKNFWELPYLISHSRFQFYEMKDVNGHLTILVSGHNSDFYTISLQYMLKKGNQSDHTFTSK